ncbi:MAG: hypothetical protein UCL21_01715 [Bacilli bacterium]|nr:hypothetical protein [Bacilli bacterium]
MKEDKSKNVIIIMLTIIIILLLIILTLVLTGKVNVNNKNDKLDNKNDVIENNNTEVNWTDKLLSYNISEIKLSRKRNTQLGDSQDIDKEVTLSKEELKQILDKISTNKLVKTYSLGRGGQDRDHLTVSYQINNQKYTFEVFAGSIVLDSADEEIKNIFNNNNYEEKNTEYKNQEGSFYYYAIEGNIESIFDEYFK